MTSTSLKRRFLVMLPLSTTLVVCGCRSDWIDTDVQNQTGQTIREIEVSYPTASFGMNNLAPSQSMHYRIQVRGSGHMHVQYTTADEKTFQGDGTVLSEHQSGHITIRLLPDGKSSFLPTIHPSGSQPTP